MEPVQTQIKKGDSNYGDYSVDLFAPGDNIETTTGQTYSTFGQTSAAAPFVTGVAALMLSIHPELTPTQLKDAIMDNVDQVAALANLCFSGGRLNAYKALSADEIHSYAAVSGTNKHRCTVNTCGYEEVHTYDLSARYSAQQHKIICSGCTAFQYQSHTYRVGSTVCTVCGYNSGGSIIMRVDSIISEIA